MSKADLRSAAFKNPTPTKIEIEYNDHKFELRQPNVKTRKLILNKSHKEGTEASAFDTVEWVAIYCTYVPGTKERVFDDTDYDAFEEMGMNGFLDQVIPHIHKLLNLEDSQGEE